MEKKRRKLYKMFTNWSLSYVVISTIAIIVIFFCAMKYNQALRSELEYTNSVQLELVQLQMDRNVKNLRAFASQANLNKMVDSLRQLDSYEEVSRYELYVLMKDLAGEMLAEGSISNTFLYFPNIDLLLSGTYYNRSRDYYDIALEAYGFAYEDWYEMIHKDYRSAQIFSLDTKSGTSLTVLIKPLDSSSRQTPAANAVMILDMEEILRASRWLSQDRDSICILDRVNGRVVSNKALEDGLDEELLAWAEKGYGADKNNWFEAGNCVVSGISSVYENWDYAVITQEQASVTRIAELQQLVFVLILLYLLISGCVVGYASFRHYLPIQKVVTILAEEEKGGAPMDGDAYEYISRSVHKLVDQNREHTSVISRQRSAISRELRHRLLTEKQDTELMDQELLKQCGIHVGDDLCCLLTYRLETTEGSGEAQRQDTRDMSWFILQNVTEENCAQEALETLCFLEGRREQVVLIWSGGEKEEVWQSVSRALAKSTEFIRGHFKFPYRIALSGLHRGTEEIYLAYREIQRVFEYQKQEEGRDVVTYQEINLLPVDTLLRYPIDVENRLIHLVSTGDGEAACGEVRQLLKDNQVNCLAPEAMQFLVSNIAASVIRVAAKNGKETTIPVSQKALMEACRQGDSQRMQKELEQLVTVASQEVGEFNRREQENQKGKLYQDIRTWVEEHYADPELSVNSIAEQFGVQPTYLSKAFKDMSGDKLSQYIHMVRLGHVKEELSGDVRLEDIAIRCGFGSQRTFLRIFKQYEGLTPTQYKELEEKKRGEERDHEGT